MNIIVVGGGKLGNAVASGLAGDGHDVTVIDVNENVFEKMDNAADVMCITGSGVQMEVLESAGVAKADLVVAATASDEVNMICCLMAKKMGAAKTVARVRAPEYAKSMTMLKEELCLMMYVNPERAAAEEIARELKFPSALNVETFAKGRLEVAEYRIEPNTALIGCSLEEVNKKFHTNVLICSVQRDQDVFIPRGDFILQEDDRINITGAAEQVSRFFQLSGLGSKKVKNVMVVGGNNTSYYLAKELIQYGCRVKIIEKDPERCQKLKDKLPDSAVILNGDGTDEDVLLEEGLLSTDSVVALTGMDEENVVISMLAMSKNVHKVVTKITHIPFGRVLSKAGVESIISPHAIAADQILLRVRAISRSHGDSMRALSRMIDNRVEMMEFEVPMGFEGIGVPLKDLHLHKDVLIAAIVRYDGKEYQPVFPNGNDCLKVGDIILVASTHLGFKNLSEMLG